MKNTEPGSGVSVSLFSGELHCWGESAPIGGCESDCQVGSRHSPPKESCASTLFSDRFPVGSPHLPQDPARLRGPDSPVGVADENPISVSGDESPVGCRVSRWLH